MPDMKWIFLVLTTFALAWGSVNVENHKTCDILGFEDLKSCELDLGFSTLRAIEETKKGKSTPLNIYVAVLNDDGIAEGESDIAHHFASQHFIYIDAKSDNLGSLDRVQIYNYDKSEIPRFVRVNGELLRRGDIHYHKDIQMLELFDLGIQINSGVHIYLSQFDKAGIQVECAVSFRDRNPDHTIPESACSSPCTWDGSNCWMPDAASYGYEVSGPAVNTSTGITLPLRKFGASLFGQAVQDIMLEVTIISETMARIKFYDPANARYEVPVALNTGPSRAVSTTEFDIIYPEQEGVPFFLQIIRKSTGTVIFDTSMLGLTFEDQLLKVAIQLPSRNVYGLGESYHSTFRRQFDDTTWAIWSRDEGPNPTNRHNLYGTHPYYSVIENDGNSHGVLLYNSNAMDYQLQSGAPAVVFRTIGGILDFYVMTGPTPEDVTKQYTSLIGKSFLPPYWSFGFQQSRWGYNSLDNMKAFVERTKSCNIPLDVFYGDIDTMDRQADFTYDPVNFAGLPEYIDEQRALGMRYVPIVDPAIASNRSGYDTYTRGIAAGAYITTENGEDILFGNVWPPEPVAFPDFFRSGTSDWWTDEITRYYQLLRFDGLWIDMNEPANFDTNIPDPNGNYRLICPVTQWDDPPYLPMAGVTGATKRINDKTLCMSNTQGENGIYKHYDVHSLYGYSETIPTSSALQAATGKRGLVFTRSSFVGSGILGGHWTGDNYAYWDHMQYSVIGLLDFNIFGVPYVGADICGFAGDSEERLCERWQELGAFYPFSRNHNIIGTIDQDPCSWPLTVGESTRKAMNVRYTLLPFFYTSFYRANQGIDGTVIRSLAWEFPLDREALGIDRQFLWRDALLISPALDIGALSVSAYFPLGNWFDYYTGEKVASAGEYTDLNVPYDFIPVHVREGYIIPTQEPAENTVASRQNAFGLIVALDGARTSKGDLFWDDGESIDTVGSGTYHFSTFDFNTDTLTHTVEHPYPEVLAGLLLDKIELFGNNGQVPTGVSGVGADATLTYDPATDKVTVVGAALPIGEAFTVTFSY